MSNEKNKYFGRDEYQKPVIVLSKKILSVKKKSYHKKIFKHTIYGDIIDTDNFLAA